MLIIILFVVVTLVLVGLGAATIRSVTYSTQITHIGSGASMAAGVMSASTDVSTALSSTNLGRYDKVDLDIMVSATASVNSASASFLVYRRDMNFDGTNDEPVPGTATASTWRPHLVGIVVLPSGSNASGVYYSLLTDIPVSDQCEFYIENTLNTAIGLGWIIKVTPKSDAFA